MNKLTIDFYCRNNVIQIAKELLGQVVVTNLKGLVTSGRIVETEAYIGLTDRASHSYGGKRTPRSEHMYARAATSYVYICYGIHQMLNIVTNAPGIPDAILIRAIEPLDGIDTMLLRRGKGKADATLTKGPGNVAKALGINKSHSGIDLLGDTIFILSTNHSISERDICCSQRIGVEYAGADALLPFRFYEKGNKYVSGRSVK